MGTAHKETSIVRQSSCLLEALLYFSLQAVPCVVIYIVTALTLSWLRIIAVWRLAICLLVHLLVVPNIQSSEPCIILVRNILVHVL